MMGVLDRMIRAWQNVPASWRRGLVTSPIAGPLRRLMNRARPSEPAIIDLAEPLSGCRMRIVWQLHKAYIFGTYEPHVVALLQEIIKPGWTVLDLGAHLGYFTLLMSRLVGSTGRVIAFEPLPEVFAVLEENMRLNNAINVVLENRAAGRRTETLALECHDAQPLPSTASLGAAGTISVAAVALDDYLRNRPERVALVKIDVEGAEGDVLEGMAEVIGRDTPTFLIEMHAFDQWGERHPALETLRRCGYATRVVGPPGAQAHVLAEPQS